MQFWGVRASVGMGDWVGSVLVICGAAAEQAPRRPSLNARSGAAQVRPGHNLSVQSVTLSLMTINPPYRDWLIAGAGLSAKAST